MSNETPKALFAALLKAQGKMGGLVPDSKNSHLQNRYASLAAVLEVVQGPLRDAGLVLYQSATLTDKAVLVMSALIHPESGEQIQEQLPIPVNNMTAQAIGGAITYGRRYLAMAMCGLAPDDDDGNEASQGQAAQRKPQPQRPQAPAPTHRNQPTQTAPPPADEPPSMHLEEQFMDAQPTTPANATPTADDKLRINALEIIEQSNIKTPGQAQQWAADNHYRTNPHSARNEWQKMITEQFGGAMMTQPKVKEAIVAYIELCLLDGKKEPATA